MTSRTTAGPRHNPVLAELATGIGSPQPLGHDSGTLHFTVTAADLEHFTHRLAETAGARLADLFAATGDPPDQVVLNMLWALDADDAYLLIQTQLRGENYPALSDIAPAAFVEECEIFEQFGVRPAGDKPLNRVAVPPQADHDIPRLGAAPRHVDGEVHAPHAVGGHAFEFPFGPVRASAQESLYYGLVTSGEEVVDLYLLTWHKYRGLEWRLQGMLPDAALFYVERAEGLSAVAQAWAFAAAVEHATGLRPDPGASRTRALALELERLYNHAAAIAALCQATGLSVGQAGAEIALERLLRVNAAVFGHRYLFGVVGIGGAQRAPDLGPLQTELPEAVAELRAVCRLLSGTNSFLDRLEATGILTTEQAVRLGLVGPVARAAGVAIDARNQHLQPPYDDVAVHPAQGTTGDVLARYQTFLAEIDESARLISELARRGATAGGTTSPRKAGSGLGWAESPRGESLAYVELDGDGSIRRARLRPASARNWRAFDDACRSQNVFTDIPIIEASFWLTVAGTAR